MTGNTRAGGTCVRRTVRLVAGVTAALVIASGGADARMAGSGSSLAQQAASGGSLAIAVDNGANRALQAVLSGHRLSGPDAGGSATAYGPIMLSYSRRRTKTVPVPSLAPGVWLHEVVVAETGQHQYRQSLMIADPAAPNELGWTLYAKVVVVNDPTDGATGACDDHCTLREAVLAANDAPSPALIVFDHQTLGTPAEVFSKKTRVQLLGAGLTIDGTDANGDPSPVVPFGERVYPTRITMVATKQPIMKPNPCPCNDNFGGTLYASARSVRLQGLQIERVYPRNPSQICCGNLTLVSMGPGSADTRVDTCLLDGGGRLLPNADTPKGNTGQATSKDCIKPENSGSTPEHPIVVSNSEISYCLDRGVKTTNTFLRLENNWIHNNLRCGLFAIVPGGEIEAAGNLIEENGYNCPAGAPPHCTNQVAARPAAPQVSAQGNRTVFALDGNVVRTGPQMGIFWQVNSTGSVDDTFVCGMGSAGVLSDRTAGEASGAVIRGSAAVLNGSSGVRVRNTVGVDLGSDGADNAGRNVFAGNPENAQVVNELSGPAISAQGNQWPSCYQAASNANQCDVDAIADGDTNNPANGPSIVDVRNPDPQEDSGGVTVTAVTPSRAAEGALIRISGAGFDAVSGLAGLTPDDCANLAMGNTCDPLNGTCVEFLADGVWTPAADVLGVTPTTLMVRTPFTCTVPTRVRVRRNVRNGAEVVSNELAFCVN